MSKLIKKIIPYFLILIILVGLFSPMGQVHAQPVTPASTTPAAPAPTDNGTCFPPGGASFPSTRGACAYTFQITANLAPAATGGAGQGNFQQRVDKGCEGITSWTFTGCLLKLVYYTWFQLPTFLLWLSAHFFNAMISYTLYSTYTANSSFIPSAWAVVRDISNIFFLLVLLYIAIQTILGLGHETKKMIARVVVMALLINFSMFFTKVVIDTSNILALVFYNKIDVEQKNPDGTLRPYDPSTSSNEKDISGAMYRSFDVTQLLSVDTLTKLQTISALPGKPVTQELPFGITFGLIVAAGIIMYYAAYTFFIAGISFLGRMIELWILIIFSPFAFMSWTIPNLSGVEYLGWDAWFKRLMSTSFMAPIFMFFMYLIFKLLQIQPTFSKNEGTVGIILFLLIPALIILAMLKKATEYAKKGGGEFGEIALKGAKMAGGLALGVATGGTALAGRAVIGGAGGALAGTMAKGAEKMGFTGVGSKLRDLKSYAQKSSFDIRGVPGVGNLAKAGGMNLGTAQTGGWSEMKKQEEERRQKRAAELEKRGTGKEKDAVAEAQIDLKEKVLSARAGQTIPIKLELENVDKEIDKARIALNDIKGTGDVAGTAAALEKLKDAQDKKDEIRGIVTNKTTNPVTGEVKRVKLPPTTGSVAALEKIVHVKEAELEVASDKITADYVKTIWGLGADDARRKIRTGTKLDSGEKPH